MKNVNCVSVISDTHGVIDPHIISYLKNSDVIIHAGDICSTKIISDLEKYCEHVFLVAGNNDIPEKYSTSEDKNIIKELNKSLTVNINNKNIIFFISL